jgi:trk system potassium uptake protein
MTPLARSILPVLNVLSVVIAIFAMTMLVPLAFAFFGRDAALPAYDNALVITLVAGAVLYLATRRYKRELLPRDGFLLVTLAWTVLPLFATLPLLFHLRDLSFTHAYFEAMSALTTTGSTVLTGLDTLPLSINIWRHLLQWIGGMGILVLTVAILPLLGVGGAQVFKAESAGPLKEHKLTPRIADTAKALYLIYFSLSFICFLAFAWAGMSWSDALMHMFSTMSLGGFSSYDASFGFWNSPVIEYTAVVFMLLAGFNFSLHFLAWRRRSLWVYLADTEAKAYVFTLVIASLAVAVFLTVQGVYPEWSTALRYATFNVVSVATTTGFASTDFGLWPTFAPVLMLFLCGFTTCAGSTGGGVKMIRSVILMKQALREFTRILHPRVINPVHIDGRTIENNVVFAVLAFMLVYGAAMTGCTLLLLLSGLDVISAFSAVVASINNTGPGLNQVGPAANYGGLDDFELWVCIFAMLIGRLELLAVLVLFTPAFWRK